nr:hypothetical protein [Vibrio sp. 1151_11]
MVTVLCGSLVVALSAP